MKSILNISLTFFFNSLSIKTIFVVYTLVQFMKPFRETGYGDICQDRWIVEVKREVFWIWGNFSFAYCGDLKGLPSNIEFCHRYQKSCQTSSKVLRDCYEASNQSADRPRCARHRDHGHVRDRPSLSLPRGDAHRSAYGDDRHANHVNRASGLQFQMCSSCE